jgi:hypothetical protein
MESDNQTAKLAIASLAVMLILCIVGIAITYIAPTIPDNLLLLGCTLSAPFLITLLVLTVALGLLVRYRWMESIEMSPTFEHFFVTIMLICSGCLFFFGFPASVDIRSNSYWLQYGRSPWMQCTKVQFYDAAFTRLRTDLVATMLFLSIMMLILGRTKISDKNNANV